MVNWVIDLDCLTDPEPRLQEKAKFKNPPQLNREVWHRICWKGLSGAIRGHERAQRSNGACSNAAHLIRICMPLFLTLQRAWSDYKGEQLPPGERGACNVRPRFFARQNAAGILRRCKWVVGDGDPRPDANSEQLEGRRCAGGAAGKYPTPKCFCFISASCWIVGVWGGEGLTEALRGPLIGRRSALWPLWWCRVTGQTARSDWLAATAVECATSGVRGWKRAAWTQTLPRPPNSLFLRPVLFFFCGRFSSLSFLQNFSINRLNIDILH